MKEFRYSALTYSAISFNSLFKLALLLAEQSLLFGMRKFGELIGAERSMCLRSFSSGGLGRGEHGRGLVMDIMMCPIDRRNRIAESLSENKSTTWLITMSNGLCARKGNIERQVITMTKHFLDFSCDVKYLADLLFLPFVELVPEQLLLQV